MWVPLFVKSMISQLVEKELKMSKRKLLVKKTDGYAPQLCGDGLLNLRSPLDLKIGPNQDVMISLGFTVNKALLVVESNNLRGEGVLMEGASVVYTPSQNEPVIKLKNNKKVPFNVFAGDVIARAAVLDSSELTVEVE